MGFLEIKNRTAAELVELMQEWRTEIRDLKFKARAGQLKQVNKIGELRRSIARAIVVLKDKK